MNILYERKKVSRDTYTFKINSGGELNIHLKSDRNIHHPVKLVFEDGKLIETEIPDMFGDERSRWLVMGAVAKMIADIEHDYHNQVIAG